jgi:hypothetical protein
MTWMQSSKVVFASSSSENSPDQPQRRQQCQRKTNHKPTQIPEFFWPTFHVTCPSASIVHSGMLLRQMDTGWNTDTNRNIRPYNPANHTNAAPSVQSKPIVTMSPI